MTLDVRLLGQLAVTRDGRRLELKSRPAQMLLAYLVLHRGQSIPRDKVAGMLWPDCDATAARKNLRQTLWRLQKDIGDEHLQVNSQSLRLRSGTTTSDVAMLRRATRADDPDHLISTVEPYRGDLLPGHYEEWIQAASRPLRAAYEERMTHLLRLLAEQERWDEVRHWAEQWISHGTVPEPAYRALMRAHSGIGDVAGVAKAYNRCVGALRMQFGAGPSVKTRALYRRLMPDRDPPVGWPGERESRPGSTVPMPSVDFVGPRAVVVASVTVNRPHDEVYTNMLDPDIIPLCRTNVLEYEIVAGTPGKEGTRVRVTRKLGTEIIEVSAEAIEAEEGRWIKSRTFDSPIHVDLETRFVDVTGGTRVTHSRAIEFPEGLFGGLDDSVAAQLYARELRSDFENLKVLLESQ